MSHNPLRELATLNGGDALTSLDQLDEGMQGQTLSLLGHISAIDDAALLRPLITGCDVFVIPERFGQVRSLLIQAMAFGMPVVASDDPFLDMLVGDETALIVSEADPDEWADQLRRVITGPDLAHRLGASARSWVADHHQSQDQIGKLVAAFEGIMSGGAHNFGES